MADSGENLDSKFDQENIGHEKTVAQQFSLPTASNPTLVVKRLQEIGVFLSTKRDA
ncbi:MAG: hypothetical protein ACREPU_14370 [Rhodanobacteraceae bacterium]